MLNKKLLHVDIFEWRIEWEWADGHRFFIFISNFFEEPQHYSVPPVLHNKLLAHFVIVRLNKCKWEEKEKEKIKILFHIFNSLLTLFKGVPTTVLKNEALNLLYVRMTNGLCHVIDWKLKLKLSYQN